MNTFFGIAPCSVLCRRRHAQTPIRKKQNTSVRNSRTNLYEQHEYKRANTRQSASKTNMWQGSIRHHTLSVRAIRDSNRALLWAGRTTRHLVEESWETRETRVRRSGAADKGCTYRIFQHKAGNTIRDSR